MRVEMERPTTTTPPEIAAFVLRIRETMAPTEIWLFGSRARGDFSSDSDWDLLAVLPDTAAAELFDPLTAWWVARTSSVPVTLLATKSSDLFQIWGLPNTLGYDLAREGVRLVD
jgi:hypothetical protein